MVGDGSGGSSAESAAVVGESAVIAPPVVPCEDGARDASLSEPNAKRRRISY